MFPSLLPSLPVSEEFVIFKMSVLLKDSVDLVVAMYAHAVAILATILLLNCSLFPFDSSSYAMERNCAKKIPKR